MDQHSPERDPKTGASPPQGRALRSFFSRLKDGLGIFLEFLRLLLSRLGIRPQWLSALGAGLVLLARLLGQGLLGLGRVLGWAGLVGGRTLGCWLGRGAVLLANGLLRAGVWGWRALVRFLRALAGGVVALGAMLAGWCRKITFGPGRRVGDRDLGVSFGRSPADELAGGLVFRLGRHPLFFGAVAVLAASALASLVYLAVLAPWEHRPGEPPLSDTLANATRGASSLRREVAMRPPVYEEFGGEDLDERVRQTDLALLEAMKAQGRGPGSLTLQDVAVRRHQDRDFHFQALLLAVKNPERFLAQLRENLARHVQNASVEVKGKLSALVRIDGVETHRLSLSLTPLPPAAGTKVQQVAANPRLAIVIDDLGEDLEFVRGLGSLPLPVAFSVWPDSSHARETARLAEHFGRDLLIHQPMEPKGYPQVNPGKSPLLANMTRDQIQATVRASLDKVPGAKGMNNHMGSRFTESGPGVKAVLEVLQGRHLFFLDSMTTQQSVGKREAARLGLPVYSRDVFLDNVAKVEAVTHQLLLAERLALTTGRAIAIGHPNAETLAALKAWAKTRDTRVSVVALTALPAE